MLRLQSLVFLALLTISGVAAKAQQGPVVVELFTSQGCSSCPPADAYLAEMAQSADILPLAFHVDYWDRLGWKDTFASRDNTNRQYAYGRAFHNRSVWTPQFIVQGRHYSKDNFRAMVAEYVRAVQADPSDVSLSVAPGSNGQLVATISGRGDSATLFLVTYEPQSDVAIKRGENRGHTLSYHNIVTSLTEVGAWNGREETQIAISAPDGAHAALFLQVRKNGPIQAALRLN